MGNGSVDSEMLIGVPIVIAFVLVILKIILLFKIWVACDSIDIIRRRLGDPMDDIRFRDRARYESEKRRGLITTADMDATEQYFKEAFKSENI